MKYRSHVYQPKSSRIRKVLLNILFWLSIIGICVSVGVLLYEMVYIPWTSHAAVNEFRSAHIRTEDSASSVSPQSQDSTASKDPTASEEPWVEPAILLDFEQLLKINSDVAGWLTVPGTNLDHPVFWTPDNQNTYLRRDAEGNYNKLGSFFLSADSTLAPQADVLVMYGHNMEDSDEAFGQLMKFKSLSFLKEHPTYSFDTLYSHGEWKIIAVCYASTKAGDLADFNYLRSDYPTRYSFEEFVRKCRLRSLYHIDDDVADGDSLLIFSTCDYSFWDERFIIVARKLRPGETPGSVSTANYENNPCYLMPETYYGLSYVNAVKPSEEEMNRAYEAYYG